MSGQGDRATARGGRDRVDPTQGQAIDRELGERTEGEIAARLAEVHALQEAARDPIAKKQLGVAEGSPRAELEQIDRIRRGRDRVVALPDGEMAPLERSLSP